MSGTLLVETDVILQAVAALWFNNRDICVNIFLFKDCLVNFIVSKRGNFLGRNYQFNAMFAKGLFIS